MTLTSETLGGCIQVLEAVRNQHTESVDVFQIVRVMGELDRLKTVLAEAEEKARIQAALEEEQRQALIDWQVQAAQDHPLLPIDPMPE